MGTRSLTYVYTEKKEPIICLYRHHDGYPQWHGRELANFLQNITVVNCYGEDKTNLANGMGCLAAQIVSRFKRGCGEFHLLPLVADSNYYQEYEYHVFNGWIKVLENHSGVEIFDGKWKQFAKFCQQLTAGDQNV